MGTIRFEILHCFEKKSTASTVHTVHTVPVVGSLGVSEEQLVPGGGDTHDIRTRHVLQPQVISQVRAAWRVRIRFFFRIRKWVSTGNVQKKVTKIMTLFHI